MLVLLDLEALMPLLRGVVMELNDCSLPLLKGERCLYISNFIKCVFLRYQMVLDLLFSMLASACAECDSELYL